MITISQAGFDAHPLIPSDSLSALSHGDLDACGSRRVTHSCCSCVCVCLCICRAVCITAVYTPRISVFACSDKWVSAHLFPLRMQIMSLVWWRFPSEAADKLKAPDTTLHFFCLYLLNVYRFLKNVIPNLSVQGADNHREKKKKKNRKFNTNLTTLPHMRRPCNFSRFMMWTSDLFTEGQPVDGYWSIYICIKAARLRTTIIATAL